MHEARHVLLEKFHALLATHENDVARSGYVDLSSDGGFLAWYNVASDDECSRLALTTPARPPYPITFLGFVDSPAEGQWREVIVAVSEGDVQREAIFAVAFFGTDRHPSLALKFTTNDQYIVTRTEITRADVTNPENFAHMIHCALTMFHVKNIELVPHTIPRSVRRRLYREEGTEPGPVTYSTIAIRPFLQRDIPKPHRAQEKFEGRGVPLHPVHGSFAHYTEEHPLFGLYPGTFWRPAHKRGNRHVGLVRPTYEIDTTDPHPPRAA